MKLKQWAMDKVERLTTEHVEAGMGLSEAAQRAYEDVFGPDDLPEPQESV